ncbi:hypothetical protein, partial [Amycolatopsis japonica]
EVCAGRQLSGLSPESGDGRGVCWTSAFRSVAEKRQRARCVLGFSFPVCRRKAATGEVCAGLQLSGLSPKSGNGRLVPE